MRRWKNLFSIQVFTNNSTSNKLLSFKNNLLKTEQTPTVATAPVGVTVKKPFVVIKDNQLKPINANLSNPHTNTTITTNTTTTNTAATTAGANSFLLASTKSNKSVLSSASNSTTNCDDIVLSSSSASSSSTTPSTSTKQQQAQPNHSISPNYCSTSSVSSSSAASSNAMPSPPPLPQAQSVSASDLMHMLPDGVIEGVIDIPIDSSHREMAIDCPDYFVPEIKTRPCFPPHQVDPAAFNDTVKLIETKKKQPKTDKLG